jgi:hypothetical protein
MPVSLPPVLVGDGSWGSVLGDGELVSVGSTSVVVVPGGLVGSVEVGDVLLPHTEGDRWVQPVLFRVGSQISHASEGFVVPKVMHSPSISQPRLQNPVASL